MSREKEGEWGLRARDPTTGGVFDYSTEDECQQGE